MTLLKTIPPYWAPVMQLFKDRVGDRTTDEGKSSWKSARRCSRPTGSRPPLLIGQGANDPRVKQAESDQIVKAMQKHKIPVDLRAVPRRGPRLRPAAEPPGVQRGGRGVPGRHLGGRYEPMQGDKYPGSTAVVEGDRRLNGFA